MRKLSPSSGYMKPQVIFDTVYAHFTKPGAKRALDADGLGVYMTDDGRKCPAGLLLGEKQCAKVKGSHLKAHHLIEASSKVGQELLARLQIWHDGAPDGTTPVDITAEDIRNLELIGAGYGLTIQKVAA